jgi:diguanylate cyclase (GGDEF)-like protein
MEDIIQRCLELDAAAVRTYAQFAARCDDPELKRVFQRMGIEERTHVEWWKALLEEYHSSRIPIPADEKDLREAIEETDAWIQQLLEGDMDNLTSDQMLEVAARLEFHMLDPAFEELMALLDPASGEHHREAYSRHVMRLVNEIEKRYSDRGLASFLARVLARSFRDQERLSALATRDQLTGVYNRRGFYNYLSQWCAWSSRYRQPLGVLIVDVDHFKDVNDTFGHPMGDQALCSIARTLSRTVRRSDLVGRYGGDEFSVLAPETSEDSLALLADRIASAVRETDLAGEANGPRLTVSVGSAYVQGGCAASPEELLSAADRSLYQAKEAGRDQAGRAVNASNGSSCEAR